MDTEIRLAKRYQKHILLLQILIRLLLLISLAAVSLLLPVHGDRLAFLTVFTITCTFSMFVTLVASGYSFRPWFYVINDTDIYITNKNNEYDLCFIKNLLLIVLTRHQSVYSIRRDRWKGLPAVALLVSQKDKPLKQIFLVYEPEDQERMDKEVMPKLASMLSIPHHNSWPPPPTEIVG